VVLLIGYGNRGRGDDGLGPEFAGRIEEIRLPGMEIDIDYQLTVDHALAIADADSVVFVDSLMGSEAPFEFNEIAAGTAGTLASHSLTPATVLALAKTLYDTEPEAWVLAIAGKEFGEVKEGLSDEAKHNLDLAEAFFLEWLSGPRGLKTAASLGNAD
jgi:hydrogenase maturation protease